jgi:UDP-glucose 4-epimerase
MAGHDPRDGARDAAVCAEWKGDTLIFENKRILITGGTGSLGRQIVHRILSGQHGTPARVIVFSRDEAKQHYMRLTYLHKEASTDEVIYSNFMQRLTFRIGDVRDYASLAAACRDVDIVIHAAALKQVPTCEYFPVEAVMTNIMGAHNLLRVVREGNTDIQTVVGISTDKACHPVNVMGMTKSIMERVLIEGNIFSAGTRFAAVRYGNVIASRGSVVPLFLEQIAKGGPVTVTHPDMTRFLLTLDQAVDIVMAAIAEALPGEIFVPRAPAVRMVEVAEVLIAGRPIPIKQVGIRPGEKLHEIMISDEETYYTVARGNYYAIQSMLPELGGTAHLNERVLDSEYSSRHITVEGDGLRELLNDYVAMSLENRVLAL